MCPRALCCTVRTSAAVAGSYPVEAAHCVLSTSRHHERQCLYTHKTNVNWTHRALYATVVYCSPWPLSVCSFLSPLLYSWFRPSLYLFLPRFPSCSSFPQISPFSHHFSSIVPSTYISPLSTLHSAVLFHSVSILERRYLSICNSTLLELWR